MVGLVVVMMVVVVIDDPRAGVLLTAAQIPEVRVKDFSNSPEVKSAGDVIKSEVGT